MAKERFLEHLVGEMGEVDESKLAFSRGSHVVTISDPHYFHQVSQALGVFALNGGPKGTRFRGRIPGDFWIIELDSTAETEFWKEYEDFYDVDFEAALRTASKNLLTIAERLDEVFKECGPHLDKAKPADRDFVAEHEQAAYRIFCFAVGEANHYFLQRADRHQAEESMMRWSDRRAWHPGSEARSRIIRHFKEGTNGHSYDELIPMVDVFTIADVLNGLLKAPKGETPYGSAMDYARAADLNADRLVLYDECAIIMAEEIRRHQKRGRAVHDGEVAKSDTFRHAFDTVRLQRIDAQHAELEYVTQTPLRQVPDNLHELVLAEIIKKGRKSPQPKTFYTTCLLPTEG